MQEYVVVTTTKYDTTVGSFWKETDDEAITACKKYIKKDEYMDLQTVDGRFICRL